MKTKSFRLFPLPLFVGYFFFSLIKVEILRHDLDKFKWKKNTSDNRFIQTDTSKTIAKVEMVLAHNEETKIKRNEKRLIVSIALTPICNENEPRMSMSERMQTDFHFFSHLIRDFGKYSIRFDWCACRLSFSSDVTHHDNIAKNKIKYKWSLFGKNIYNDWTR